MRLNFEGRIPPVLHSFPNESEGRQMDAFTVIENFKDLSKLGDKDRIDLENHYESIQERIISGVIREKSQMIGLLNALELKYLRYLENSYKEAELARKEVELAKKIDEDKRHEADCKKYSFGTWGGII